MTPAAQAAARDCTEASDAELLPFPQVIARLADAGVERYHADLLRAEKTYFQPDGASLVVPSHAAPAPARAFCATGVQAAVRDSQSGAIGYRAFCARIAAAGCVGYLVSLPGARAVYYGRTGETHVEHLPQAT